MKLSRKKFSKLYDKLLNKVFRFVYLKTGQQEVAQDLTAQVFTKVWKKVKGGLDIENPKAYIFQVTRAQVADYFRKKAKFQVVSTAAVEIEDASLSLEDKASQMSDWQIAQAGIKNLSEESQTAISLRYVNGLSIKEVAKIMEKSQGATRVMLHRALQELRSKM